MSGGQRSDERRREDPHRDTPGRVKKSGSMCWSFFLGPCAGFCGLRACHRGVSMRPAFGGVGQECRSTFGSFCFQPSFRLLTRVSCGLREVAEGRARACCRFASSCPVLCVWSKEKDRGKKGVPSLRTLCVSFLSSPCSFFSRSALAGVTAASDACPFPFGLQLNGTSAPKRREKGCCPRTARDRVAFGFVFCCEEEKKADLLFCSPLVTFTQSQLIKEINLISLFPSKQITKDQESRIKQHSRQG